MIRVEELLFHPKLLEIMPKQFLLKSEQQSIDFVKSFVPNLKAGDIITLTGDLGSGKTFICREIIRHFCGSSTKVSSPTFNILKTYQSSHFTIYHFDLYRLKSKEEIYELGMEEAFSNGLSLIEWPEIITHLLPSDIIDLRIQVINKNTRLILV